MSLLKYKPCTIVPCFDGDPPESQETTPSESETEETKQKTEEIVRPPDGFTPEQQKKFNNAIAEERRKQEAKYQRELEKTEATYKELLASSNSLTEKERKVLQENLDAIQGQLRSRELQSAQEKKELEASYREKLTAAEKRAEAAEARWEDSTITRSLLDAAVEHDAYEADHIVVYLRPHTRLIENMDDNGKGTGTYEVVVDFADKDGTTGQDVMTTKSPSEAVKRMAEMEKHKCLFKKNVVSGVGGNSAIGGLAPGSSGKIDPRTLTPDQWMKIRKENPELIGLTRKSRS